MILYSASLGWWVVAAKSGWNENFQILPKEFFSVMPEHPFDLSVHQYDLAVAVDNHHCVGCCPRQHVTILFFGTGVGCAGESRCVCLLQ